jgi:RNA polymerase subunit RPABC4/transcription elongation factor Spt4
VVSSKATACKYCGSVNKYHKEGCPNNPKWKL